MKRKYLDGSNWAWLAERSYKWMYIEGEWQGYISLVKMGEVSRKLKTHYNPSICLCDDGYKGIIFLPDHETWCVTAIYDRNNEIVEWYFDITKTNGVDERGIPYFEDLYLDVIVAPDFSVYLIDEDELKEAVEEKKITQEEYNLAYDTYERLVKEMVSNKDFLTKFLAQYLKLLEH